MFRNRSRKNHFNGRMGKSFSVKSVKIKGDNMNEEKQRLLEELRSMKDDDEIEVLKEKIKQKKFKKSLFGKLSKQLMDRR